MCFFFKPPDEASLWFREGVVVLGQFCIANTDLIQVIAGL